MGNGPGRNVSRQKIDKIKVHNNKSIFYCLLICDAVQAVSVDLLELLHVGGVHPQLLQQRPRLLQHAGPVHQAGQRDPALQVNVVIKLRNVITRLSS